MNPETKSRIEAMLNEHAVFLFMKGTPEMPQCGFSMRAVNILDHLGVDYGTFNVLSDMEVREGIKQFANWPTIPQLYVRGEFLGGSDIMMEMYQNGELQKAVAG
jgi:monothiol glutaredoxin